MRKVYHSTLIFQEIFLLALPDKSEFVAIGARDFSSERRQSSPAHVKVARMITFVLATAGEKW